MCSLFSVFTLFLFILGKPVRKFRFHCYIWLLWRCV